MDDDPQYEDTLTSVGPVPDSAHQDPSLVCHRSPLTHLPEDSSEGIAPCASEAGPLPAPGPLSSPTCVCGWHSADPTGQVRSLGLRAKVELSPGMPVREHLGNGKPHWVFQQRGINIGNR